MLNADYTQMYSWMPFILVLDPLWGEGAMRCCIYKPSLNISYSLDVICLMVLETDSLVLVSGHSSIVLKCSYGPPLVLN